MASKPQVFYEGGYRIDIHEHTVSISEAWHDGIFFWFLENNPVLGRYDSDPNPPYVSFLLNKYWELIK